MTRRQLLSVPFAVARPGYRYAFPRDHYAHPEFQTEWWYYTGNLFTPSRRRFGFELTFFRQAVSRETPATAWDLSDLYMAHFALSDLSAGRFHHHERVNRSGPGLAGAGPATVWNGNWQAGPAHLRALAGDIHLDLRLAPAKPPVIHGRDGVSQKAEGPGRASHYISLPRITASGALTLAGERHAVSGSAWMDHEFFTHQLDKNQAGWDWFSIQLDNNTELMLFRLRRRDGSIDPFSAGTFIDAAGRPRHLAAGDFRLEPSEPWTSPRTGARYPLRWRITVPPLGLTLFASTPLSNQELVSRSSYAPTYWEGAMDYSGSMRGTGYLEMTGYDRAVTLP